MGKARWRTPGIFGLYGLLTILVTWPLTAELGRSIPGSEGDAWVHLWTFNWVKDSLASGHSVYFTNLLYFPRGTSLISHNFAWLHIGLWLPLQALIGGGAAYSIIFMAAFAFTAATTYLFVRDLLKSDSAAFVAGLIAGFWPYNLSHHNHPNLIFIGFIPLTLLTLKRMFERQRPRDALWAGVCLAFVGITRWQLLLIGGPLIAFYWLYAAWPSIREGLSTVGFVSPLARDSSSHGLPRWIWLSAIVLVLAFLIMLPLLSPLLFDQTTYIALEEDNIDNQVDGQTDLMAYFIPSRYHPLWGGQAFKLTENFVINRVFTPYLGLVTLLLAVYGSWQGGRATRFWWLIALLYVILALGGSLRFNSRFLFPLPYVLLQDTLIGTIIRRSDRFNVILSLPMAVLAAYGVKGLWQRWPQPRTRRLLLAAASTLIIFEYMVDYPVYPLTTPAWHQRLAAEQGNFAILDLPMQRRDFDEHYMFYQLSHHKPIVGGHVSRPPLATFGFINTIPFLRDFGVDKEPIPEMVDVGHQLRLLAAANVRYLVLHKKFLSPEQIGRWQTWLAINSIYEDDEVIVYHTALEQGRDYTFTHRFLSGVGIGLVHSAVTPTDTTQDGWLTADINWGSDSPVVADYDVCFQLADVNGTVQQRDCQPLAPTRPTATWQAGEIVRSRYQTQVSPYLPSGIYQLQAVLWDGSQPIGLPAPLADVRLTALARTFEQPTPSHTSDLRWANTIGLLGYDTAENGNSLYVTLHWQALGRMSKSYVVFLHLIDNATGELVAQADAAPRGWAYPTNWWEKGEVITDTMVLSLDEVPAGSYTLKLGLYDAETGERVTAATAAGQTFPDNAAPLLVFQR